MLKTWGFAVSFESGRRPVETVRGEVEAGGLGSAVSKACRMAKKACPGVRYRSVVVVVEVAGKGVGVDG